jgi:hypothetical protein
MYPPHTNVMPITPIATICRSRRSWVGVSRVTGGGGVTRAAARASGGLAHRTTRIVEQPGLQARRVGVHRTLAAEQPAAVLQDVVGVGGGG